jgi:hypothetical protein
LPGVGDFFIFGRRQAMAQFVYFHQRLNLIDVINKIKKWKKSE